MPRPSANSNGSRFGDGLEIGSGTGYFSLNLLQLGVIERLTATDISAGMLARLASTAAGLGLEVKTVATEAEALPFEDESFDLVFGHAVLHHIPDLEARLFRISSRPAPRRRDRLRRRALALRRPPRRAAEASRRCCWRRSGAAACGARPAPCPKPSNPAAMPLRARSTSTPSPRADLRRAARGCRLRAAPGRRRGAARQRLGLGPAHGRVNARSRESVSLGWRRFAFRSYIALQKVDTRLLEPRLPAELFYNLLVSGPQANRSSANPVELEAASRSP